MADESYATHKCFVLSPEGYEEITYDALCRRRESDPSYAQRKFIPLHGMLMEVTPEEYADFYRTQNRQAYYSTASTGSYDTDSLTDSYYWLYTLSKTARDGITHALIYGCPNYTDETLGSSEPFTYAATQLIILEYQLGQRTNATQSVRFFSPCSTAMRICAVPTTAFFRSLRSMTQLRRWEASPSKATVRNMP